MAVSTIKQNKALNGLIPELRLQQDYGTGRSINIDRIDSAYGYIMLITVGNGFSGTSPIPIIGGNTFLLIGFSSMSKTTNLPRYGVQIAFGFGSNKIAIRSRSYVESGQEWGDWKTINAT